MNTDTATAPIGGSPWEIELYRMLTSHVATERSLLEDYMTAADGVGSKALTYLVNLLVDDEKRHHRMFLDLAASLKSDAELAPDDPAVPRIDFNRHNAGHVVEVTNRLLANEEADAKELKRLKKALHDVEDTTLWSLLVDLMLRDTEKHIAILEFATRTAKQHKR